MRTGLIGAGVGNEGSCFVDCACHEILGAYGEIEGQRANGLVGVLRLDAWCIDLPRVSNLADSTTNQNATHREVPLANPEVVAGQLPFPGGQRRVAVVLVERVVHRGVDGARAAVLGRRDGPRKSCSQKEFKKVGREDKGLLKLYLYGLQTSSHNL